MPHSLYLYHHRRPKGRRCCHYRHRYSLIKSNHFRIQPENIPHEHDYDVLFSVASWLTDWLVVVVLHFRSHYVYNISLQLLMICRRHQQIYVTEQRDFSVIHHHEQPTDDVNLSSSELELSEKYSFHSTILKSSLVVCYFF